jgi:hypothetical protein
MWDVDRSGSFEFSDRFATSLGKLFTYDDQRLASDLHATFAGQDVTVEEVHLFVLTATPAVNYKGALGTLFRDLKLRVVSGQARKGDFSNPNAVLHFVANPIPTSLFTA